MVIPDTVPAMAVYVLRVKPLIKIKLTIVIMETSPMETGTGGKPAKRAGISTVTMSTQVNTSPNADFSPCPLPRRMSAAKKSPSSAKTWLSRLRLYSHTAVFPPLSRRVNTAFKPLYAKLLCKLLSVLYTSNSVSLYFPSRILTRSFCVPRYRPCTTGSGERSSSSTSSTIPTAKA